VKAGADKLAFPHSFDDIGSNLGITNDPEELLDMALDQILSPTGATFVVFQ
jgi:hypothetical protein